MFKTGGLPYEPQISLNLCKCKYFFFFPGIWTMITTTLNFKLHQRPKFFIWKLSLDCRLWSWLKLDLVCLLTFNQIIIPRELYGFLSLTLLYPARRVLHQINFLSLFVFPQVLLLKVLICENPCLAQITLDFLWQVGNKSLLEVFHCYDLLWLWVVARFVV